MPTMNIIFPQTSDVLRDVEEEDLVLALAIALQYHPEIEIDARPLRGILFAGDGDEVEREDYYRDDTAFKPLYPGDMDAAMVVAQAGFPWLLFEHWVIDGQSQPWTVSAFSTEAGAHDACDDAMKQRDNTITATLVAFYFDGRSFEPLPNETFTSYVGFRPKDQKPSG